MNITVAQIFQIGSVLITLIGFMLGLRLDPSLIAGITTAVLTAWNAIGAILTGQSAQVASIARKIDEPDVKALMVPAVANLEGVDNIKTNARADATLRSIRDNKFIQKVT